VLQLVVVDDPPSFGSIKHLARFEPPLLTIFSRRLRAPASGLITPSS
jgi:hypothetical protein